jgi:hypothetical protein
MFFKCKICPLTGGMALEIFHNTCTSLTLNYVKIVWNHQLSGDPFADIPIEHQGDVIFLVAPRVTESIVTKRGPATRVSQNCFDLRKRFSFYFSETRESALYLPGLPFCAAYKQPPSNRYAKSKATKHKNTTRQHKNLCHHNLSKF